MSTTQNSIYLKMQKRSTTITLLTALLISTVVVFGGCDSSSVAGNGHLTVRLTDMPFPFDDAAEANVTIVRVELIGTDSTNAIVLSDSSQSFNLLELRDGVTAVLADLEIPSGRYSQLRIIVAEDASVVMKDSTEFALKVPSGTKTGIKVNLPAFDFSDVDDQAVITVDFNVDESFVVRGTPQTVAGITGFLFKPVLKIVEFDINGSQQKLTEIVR